MLGKDGAVAATASPLEIGAVARRRGRVATGLTGIDLDRSKFGDQGTLHFFQGVSLFVFFFATRLERDLFARARFVCRILLNFVRKTIRSNFERFLEVSAKFNSVNIRYYLGFS